MIRISLALFLFSASAHAGLEHLKSYRVWAAVKACHALTGGCATKFEVKAGHHNHIKSSCHYVDRAVDIYGSETCLNWFARCLYPQPYALFCYKNWGIGGWINYFDGSKCVPSDHRTHIHVQPMGGCKSGDSDD